jgi:hypothetical protein
MRVSSYHPNHRTIEKFLAASQFSLMASIVCMLDLGLIGLATMVVDDGLAAEGLLP